MASATEHRPVSSGSLSGSANALNGSVLKRATRPADDDDSVGTEQFPAFDPLHDGSEEDDAAGDNAHYYTHSTGANGVAGVNGSSGAEAQEDQGKSHVSNHNNNVSNVNNDDDEDDDDEDEYVSTPLSAVEPVPVSEQHLHSYYYYDADDATTETSAMTSPSITSPPYWQHGHGHGLGAPASHPIHNQSTESLVPGAITLQDNEAEEDEGGEPAERHSEETRTSYGRDRNRACWAKSVEVTSYVIVNGSATNIGAFVVWNIRVETLSGPFMNIRKRYSEFDAFRRQLIHTFPNFEAAVPTLPPKSVIGKFRPRFLEKRRAGLQYFLNCILLNPEFSGSPVLKDFLFS